MSVIIKNRQAMPDAARIGFDLCEQFGFIPVLDMEFKIPDKRVQVRSNEHNAPRSEVFKYAAAMKNGDKFPPAKVTMDGYIVDGNTTLAAAKQNGLHVFPCLVLDSPWLNASDETRQRIQSLGTAFNVRNGRGISKDELRKALERLSQNKRLDATRIAALLSTSISTVQNYMAERRAVTRVEEAGLTINGELDSSQWRALGLSAHRLNDEPFLTLVELTKDAGLSQEAITSIANKCKQAKSDDGAMIVLMQERKDRKSEIADYKFSGKKKISVSSELRRKLGFVLKRKNRPEDLVERSIAIAYDHLDVMKESISVLCASVEVQERYNAERSGGPRLLGSSLNEDQEV
jgi:hypothetical protein